MMSEEMKTLAKELPSRTSFQVIAETLVFSMINYTAFIGNLLVILVVYRNTNLRTIPNMCVVALAISDIFMSSFCMPFLTVTLAKGEWIFGETYCRVHGFGVFIFRLVSLHTLVLISISRYVCVVRPNQFKIFFTKRRTLLLLVAVWCLGTVNSLPPFFFKPSGFKFHPGKAMCLYNFYTNIGFTLYIETMYVATPLLLISVCYAKVFQEVSRTNKLFSQHNDMQSLKANIVEAKVTKILVTVLVGFLVCWFPVAVIHFIDMAHGRPALARPVYVLYISLVHVSCTINPFIYGIMNRTFRREYFLFVRDVFCFKTTGVTVELQTNEN